MNTILLVEDDLANRAVIEDIFEFDDIGAELVDFGVFRLATGDEVELPVYWGKVGVGGDEVETWFIPGDSLLGMEFLSLVGSSLSLDLEGGLVELVLR